MAAIQGITYTLNRLEPIHLIWHNMLIIILFTKFLKFVLNSFVELN